MRRPEREREIEIRMRLFRARHSLSAQIAAEHGLQKRDVALPRALRLCVDEHRAIERLRFNPTIGSVVAARQDERRLLRLGAIDAEHFTVDRVQRLHQLDRLRIIDNVAARLARDRSQLRACAREQFAELLVACDLGLRTIGFMPRVHAERTHQQHDEQA